MTYIFVGRDPRDVALSWDNHRANLNFDAFFATRARAVGTDDLAELLPDGPPPPPPADPAERYWEWIEDSTPIALAPTPSYSDLQADLAGQMRALAAGLGIDVPEERWHDLPGDPDGTRYAAAVAPLAGPEVLDWAHRGPSWRA